MRLLCSAIIGMQYQRFVAQPPLPPARPFNQRGSLAAFANVDFPCHQLAAKQVDDGIQVEKHATYLAR